MYCDHVSNALGMALYDARGEMCAVAGATDNGEYLWELGINSFSDGHGYGAAGCAVVRGSARVGAAFCARRWLRLMYSSGICAPSLL